MIGNQQSIEPTGDPSAGGSAHSSRKTGPVLYDWAPFSNSDWSEETRQVIRARRQTFLAGVGNGVANGSFGEDSEFSARAYLVNL